MLDDRFDRASWALVMKAGQDTPEGRAALSTLCKAYWFPVYALRINGAAPGACSTRPRDQVRTAITHGERSTGALAGSAEKERLH
ncbi:hypothetical protein [Sorangium sp. So ce394]|uniref:hypothetical protein n=1 Tax=Sorangium sp. So ce394 TaxID=3133310 RepID=UPI003F5BDA1B